MDYLVDFLLACARNIPIEVYYPELDARFIGYNKEVIAEIQDAYIEDGRPTYVFISGIKDENTYYGNGLYIECE